MYSKYIASDGFIFDMFNIFAKYTQFQKNQSTVNLYKTITLGANQKWSSWIDSWSSYKNTCIKRPQTKSGRSWQIFSFYSHCERFINNKESLE